MKPDKRTIWIEWGMILVLFALTAGLAWLQFQWVGELGRAEAGRLRERLAEQARSISRQFDADLGEAIRLLKPSGSEMRLTNLPALLASRQRAWLESSNGLPLARIGLALREERRLLFLDPHSGAVTTADWPEAWARLREYVDRVTAGGRPAFRDPEGILIESPVFASGAGRGPGPEAGWLLLELDLRGLRERWFPGMVEAHLSLLGEQPYDAEVGTPDDPTAIYSTGQSPVADGLVSVRLHGSLLAGRRRDAQEGAWVLRVAPRPGRLEAIMSRSRRRNLLLAMGANLLLLAAGLALVFHTRRSRELARDRLRFVATVSHELRTPITVLRGAGYNLLRGIASDPAQVRRYAELILHNTQQLQDLTEQTLVLTSAGRGTSGLRKSRIQLEPVIQEALAGAAEDVRRAGCTVETRLPEDLPAVDADPSALRRILQNLVSNAAKHGGQGGWIGIQAAVRRDASPPMLEIRVDDRGPGIPRQEQGRVFEPFFRGAAALDAQTRGSGLGLAVVQELVAAHGGSVHLDSEPGSGTCVRFRLPILP